MTWLDAVQLSLQLAACYTCYMWGKQNGVTQVVTLFLDKEIITEKDLDKFED